MSDSMDRLEEMDAEWMDAALGPSPERGGRELAEDALAVARRSERLNRVIVANGWVIIVLAATSVALQAWGLYR